MIVEFSLGNYRSFNEIQTLSFRATGLKSEDETVDENNIAIVDGQRLLKTVGVYGANASGKSNLLGGLHFFKRIVVNSLERFGSTYNIMRPFRLSSDQSDNFGYFQVILFLQEKKYRYGFTLNNEGIATEWLFGPAEKNETFYFTRKEKSLNINQEYFQEGMDIPHQTKMRSDTTFLTFCSAYNGQISNEIRNFFDKQMEQLSVDITSQYNNIETNTLIADGKKQKVLSWLKDAGLTFTDVNVKNMGVHLYNNEDGPFETFFEGTVDLYKNLYNSKGEVTGNVIMDLDRDESEGTQKFYSFIGKLHAKFENGGLLVSDEIDSNFHPALLRKIIGMFNNPAINKTNAQLLFTSHDTNLMSPDIMRRDQFYFTEKSPTDATVLYSLSDLKGIRNNADFAKQYLAGYYGALPMLGNYLEEQINPEK